MRKLLTENLVGFHISQVCEQAVRLSREHNETVCFDFNGIRVEVAPTDSPKYAEARWARDTEEARQKWLASPERAEQERLRAEEEARKDAEEMVETAITEEQMRDTPAPWPRTEKQLLQYVGSLVGREHDYGTCVYAMSKAACAAFCYVSHKLGCTGAQAGFGALDVTRRLMYLKGAFMVVDVERMLYPQYDIFADLRKLVDEAMPHLRERARELLVDSPDAHPDVRAHWERLANGENEKEE